METIDIQIKSNAPEVAKETTSLRQQVKDLRKEMESCAVGSDEYNAALERLAETTAKLKNQQEDLTNAVVKHRAAQLDLGTIMDTTTGLASNLAAGYATVKSAQALMNKETRDSMSTGEKLVGVLTLLQGTKGLKGLVKNLKGAVGLFKGFAAAIGVSTAALSAILIPLTLVIGALTIIANHNAKVKVAALTSEFDRQKEEVATLNDDLQKHHDYLEDTGASQLELAQDTYEATLALYDQNEALIRQKEILKGELDSRHKIFISWLNGEKAAAKELGKQLDELYEKRKIYAQQAQDAEYNITRVQRREETRRKEEASRAAKAAAKEKEREREREVAAAKAAAEKIAEEERKAAEKVRQTWKEYLDKIIEDFSNFSGAIGLTQQNISKPNSDIDAFMAVYGLSSEEFKKKLTGAFIGILYDTNQQILASNAELDQKLAAQNELRVKSVGIISEELVDTILATTVNISDIYDDLGNVLLHFENTVSTYSSSWIENAKQVPAAFKENYDAIKLLYNEGVITESEYRASLLNLEKQYQDDNAAMMYEVLKNSKTSWEELRDQGIITQEEYNDAVSRLHEEMGDEAGKFYANMLQNAKFTSEQIKTIYYELIRKPLEFAQEVESELETTWTNQFEVYKQIADKFANKAEVSYRRASEATSEYTALFGRSYFDIKKGQDEWLSNTNAQISALENLITAIQNELAYEKLSVEQKIFLQGQLDAAMEELATREMERNRQVAEDKAANFQRVLEVTESGLSATANLLNSIADIYTQKSKELHDKAAEALEKGNEKEAKALDEAAKEQFENSKKLQIAQAIISGAAGVAQAIAGAMQLGPIAGPIIGAINAAAVIASTIAQIAAIKQTKYDSALSSGTSGSSNIPDTSFTLQSTDAYQTELSDETQTDLQANAKNNQRVYVVSSDISNAQSNEKTTVTTATF